MELKRSYKDITLLTFFSPDAQFRFKLSWQAGQTDTPYAHISIGPMADGKYDYEGSVMATLRSSHMYALMIALTLLKDGDPDKKYKFQAHAPKDNPTLQTSVCVGRLEGRYVMWILRNEKTMSYSFPDTAILDVSDGGQIIHNSEMQALFNATEFAHKAGATGQLAVLDALVADRNTAVTPNPTVRPGDPQMPPDFKFT